MSASGSVRALSVGSAEAPDLVGRASSGREALGPTHAKSGAHLLLGLRGGRPSECGSPCSLLTKKSLHIVLGIQVGSLK